MNDKVREAMREAEAAEAEDRLPPIVGPNAKLIEEAWQRSVHLFPNPDNDPAVMVIARAVFFTGAASLAIVMQSNGASPAHAMAAHSAVTREINEFTESIKNRGNNNE